MPAFRAHQESWASSFWSSCFSCPFWHIFSASTQLFISLAASPWRRLSPQLLGAVSFKSLHCCPYLSTLASFICRVFFFFLIFPRCHFGHNGCLWDLSEWSVSAGRWKGRSPHGDAFSKRALKLPRRKNVNSGTAYALWIKPMLLYQVESPTRGSEKCGVIQGIELSRVRHSCP